MELCWCALHEISVLMGKNGKGVTTVAWILGLKYASGLFTLHLFNLHEMVWHTFAQVKFSSICMPSICWWMTVELMEAWTGYTPTPGWEVCGFESHGAKVLSSWACLFTLLLANPCPLTCFFSAAHWWWLQMMKWGWRMKTLWTPTTQPWVDMHRISGMTKRCWPSESMWHAGRKHVGFHIFGTCTKKRKKKQKKWTSCLIPYSLIHSLHQAISPRVYLVVHLTVSLAE